jgi:hypothetical protein
MIIWKCVRANELESFTRGGWHMEQILVASRVETVPHSAPAQVVNNNNNGYSSTGSTVPVDSPILVQEPMFLLKKDSEVESREHELQAALADTKKTFEDWKREFDKVNRERNTYKEEADKRTEQLGAAAGVQQKLNEEKRKMEADMAKVRQAIGDLKYFEIVGKS